MIKGGQGRTDADTRASGLICSILLLACIAVFAGILFVGCL